MAWTQLKWAQFPALFPKVWWCWQNFKHHMKKQIMGIKISRWNFIEVEFSNVFSVLELPLLKKIDSVGINGRSTEICRQRLIIQRFYGSVCSLKFRPTISLGEKKSHWATIQVTWWQMDRTLSSWTWWCMKRQHKEHANNILNYADFSCVTLARKKMYSKTSICSEWMIWISRGLNLWAG